MLPTDFIAQNFDLAFMGASAWIFLVVAVSVIFRRSRGKAIFPGKPDGAIFYERTGSGHSRKNVLTMIGGAQNCLIVAVTQYELIIQPWFPFNLMFLPEIYDLEHRILRTSIREIKESNFLLWKNVRIEFSIAAGGTRTILLVLRNRDEFVKALRGTPGAL